MVSKNDMKKYKLNNTKLKVNFIRIMKEYKQMGGKINGNGNNKPFQNSKLGSTNKSNTQKFNKSTQGSAFTTGSTPGASRSNLASQVGGLFGAQSSAKKSSSTIKTTGNYNFDTDTNTTITKSDYSKLKKAGGKAGKLFGDGSVNIKDGINAEEAKNIIVELEDSGFLEDDKLTRKEVKQFMKNLGMKTGKGTTSAIDQMSKILKKTINAFQETKDDTAAINEKYTSVTDIATNHAETLTIKPKNNMQIQTVSQIDNPNDSTSGNTLRSLINKGYNIEDVCKEKGITDTNGVMHNAIDEYLQSNPELSDRMVELYNKDKADIDKITDIKDLNYEQIADINLYDPNNINKFEIITPEFKVPLPTSETMSDTKLEQKQFATKNANTKVDISKDSEYKTVEDALAGEYGLNKDEMGENAYNNALSAIAFQVANNHENAEIIETLINQENTKEYQLNDNSRVTRLLQMTEVKDLHLPDNVLINTIGNVNDYNYNSEIYQLSPRSADGNEVLSKMKLSSNAGNANIKSLEDMLKFAYDPRTGEALKGANGLNIKDKTAQSLANAYMLNSIKDNPGIFAATQKIDGKTSVFGAYDIDESKLDLGKDKAGNNVTVKSLIKQVKADAKKSGEKITYREAAEQVRDQLINKYGGGSLDNFLEKFGSINLDTAKGINFYDDTGSLRFKNSNGKALNYNFSETYVRFGADAAGNGATSSLGGNGSGSGNPGAYLNSTANPGNAPGANKPTLIKRPTANIPSGVSNDSSSNKPSGPSNGSDSGDGVTGNGNNKPSGPSTTPTPGGKDPVNPGGGNDKPTGPSGNPNPGPSGNPNPGPGSTTPTPDPGPSGNPNPGPSGNPNPGPGSTTPTPNPGPGSTTPTPDPGPSGNPNPGPGSTTPTPDPGPSGTPNPGMNPDHTTNPDDNKPSVPDKPSTPPGGSSGGTTTPDAPDNGCDIPDLELLSKKKKYKLV